MTDLSSYYVGLADTGSTAPLDFQKPQDCGRY